jgi:hypothetical protein
MYKFPRCQIVPLADHQVSLQIDGDERLRWHFSDQYPRPYFFPLVGPAGQSLTRMGHPGAPNHDHHQSIWFAHDKVLGISFWNNHSPATIRQTKWLCYEDGDEEAVMAVQLGWFDGHDPAELIEQELIAILRPGDPGETMLELQSTFRPRAERLEFGKTNFGFLAVRVAKSISAYFGGGQLTNSEGAVGEPAIFGHSARWMDYSGPVPAANSDRNADGVMRRPAIEGITYFDHPDNNKAATPAHWHVREDGWMGASPGMHGPIMTTKSSPLVLRYLLHAHTGEANPDRANAIADAFAQRKPYGVRKSTVKHHSLEIVRPHPLSKG